MSVLKVSVSRFLSVSVSSVCIKVKLFLYFSVINWRSQEQTWQNVLSIKYWDDCWADHEMCLGEQKACSCGKVIHGMKQERSTNWRTQAQETTADLFETFLRLVPPVLVQPWLSTTFYFWKQPVMPPLMIGNHVTKEQISISKLIQQNSTVDGACLF